MLLKQIILPVFIVVVTSLNLSAQQQSEEISVTGTVYFDENQNGMYDSREKGLEGVLVSNQREVVSTDAQGVYRINISPGQALMVIKPAGYNVPVDEHLIPQFSYIYEPGGSPENLEYGGLDSSYSLPDQVNFPLTKAGGETRFNALIFGDPQPRDHKELDYVRDTFVNQAANEEASFMMILGDIMYNDLSLFDRHKTLMAQTGIPAWHVIGNHDIDFDAPGNRHARDTYKQQFGANYYAFQYGDVTFIVLDNVDYQGRGDNTRPSYVGNIWGDQLSWLENLLAYIPENQLIVIGTHIPIYAWGGKAENVNTLNRARLFDLLKDRKQILALSGHLHMTYHHFLGEEEGWRGEGTFHHLIATTVSGTWWGGPNDENNIPVTTQRDGVPNGYHRFTFDGSSYSEQLVGLEENEHFQLRIETPGSDVTSADSLKELVVNVFNGNEKNNVWCRVNNGEWKEMTRVNRSSPYYEHLLSEFSGDWSSSLRAISTNHLWVSDISGLEDADLYRFEVKTTDMYNQEWKTTKIVEIE